MQLNMYLQQTVKRRKSKMKSYTIITYHWIIINTLCQFGYRSTIAIIIHRLLIKSDEHARAL